MKFKNYLESITGVGIYPMISLFIFFLFFAALLYYVLKADKKRILEIKQIPLENNKNEENSKY